MEERKRLKISNGLNHLIFIHEYFNTNVYMSILIFHISLWVMPEYTNTG